ncbi:copper resistance protein CopC [Pseudomonas sp. TH04]|nr:copper resistance protein CopC [Pseudomonas fluorescens]MBK5543517.1 copper resistance protein CopC [Pseudomonas sp. TH04]NNB68395.1 copper resistance protein CopC [Pseudomonas fluorescens]OPB02121.1 hypothetical protein BFW91_27170 [Pseudomonas fluorescens]UEL25730.1 copper resistance protein CopC [Pseudomonas fluorescens]
MLASFATATAAFAHAHLESETPAPDRTVSAPQQLRQVFSEGVEATFTPVTLTGGSNSYSSEAKSFLTSAMIKSMSNGFANTASNRSDLCIPMCA